MTTKQVRFFTPVLIDASDQRQPIQAGFWPTIATHIGGLTEVERRVRYGGAPYYGESGVGVARAYPYVRIGRIRQRAEWPDTVDTAYKVRPLALRDRNLFEAAYLVPFGTANKVAFLGPMRGIVSTGAAEFWLTTVLGLAANGESVELIPEVDPQLAAKLDSAVGVSKLSVRVPHDANLQMQGQGGQVQSAIANAVAAAQDEVDVEVTFSYGRRTPVGGVRSELLSLAQRLARSQGPSKIDVSLILPDADGFKVEQHELVEDNIAIKTTFDVADDARLDVDDILDGIHKAIQDFRAL